LLCSSSQYVGYEGTGSFTQSGGTNSVSNVLYVGYFGNGTYNLSGNARLSAASEYVGAYNGTNPLFQQSGGINSTTSLSVGYGSRYLLSGGTLQASNGFAIAPNYEFLSAGTLDGGNGSGVISIAGPAIVFLSGDIVNTSATSLSIGADSLLIVPSGMNPATVFGSYSNSGMVHTAGTVLTVPAGQGFGGTGTIADPVDCQGTITAVGGQINFRGGLNIAGTGAVDLGASSGNLVTNDSISGIAGGSLVTAYHYVGYSGTGSFTQSGGTNSVSNSLCISDLSESSSGNYNLSGSGVLCANSEYVGYGGAGSFTQSGGTNSAGFLYLSYYAGSGSGSYNLSGSGQLSAANEYVGCRASATALFQQSGGINNTAFLSINSAGRYLLTGGTLAVSNGFASAGTLDGGNSPATISIADPAIIDLSQGTIVNTASTSLSIAANSLLIVPPAVNPAAVFGSYSNAGMVHTAGTVLTVSAGQGFGGTGTIADPVNCQGTIAAAGGPICLSGGLNVSGTGAVNLGASSGTLVTQDNFSGIVGGSLATAYHYVGYSGTGSFTQSGGMNSVSNSLFLGYNSGGSGNYNLSRSGVLSANSEYVGYLGAGSFTQSGGTNLVGSLYLVYDSGNSSSYNLSGPGVLSANLESIGCYAGTGCFTQSGGTNSVSSALNFGYYSGSAGSYYLSGGLLVLSGSGLSNCGGGSAAFYFSGGTLQAGSSWSTTVPITLPASGSVGTFDTNGCTLALNVPLAGPGGLAVAGGGVLALPGSNTYTGPTTINQGALVVNGSLVSPVTVNSGGTLAGMGSLLSVTVNSGGHLAPGDALGQLTLSGNLALLGGAVLDYALDTPADSDEVLLPSGLLSLNGQHFSDFNFTPLAGFGQGTYTLIDAGSISGTLGPDTSGTIDGLPASLAVQGDDLVLNVVPEPGTLSLLGAATLAVIGLTWRREPQDTRNTRKERK
jgi:autotransporter-associated beta strand protein